MQGYDDVPAGATGKAFTHADLAVEQSRRRRKEALVSIFAFALTVVAFVIIATLIADTVPRPGIVLKEFPSDGSAMEFFELSDAMKVKWYHGANSVTEMDRALVGPYMMLEGDINLRFYGSEEQTDEPVMAHDPGDSDNTLDNWLDNVLARHDKAPKLDFKSMEAVEPSLMILATKVIKHPIWLNADVVQGPGGGDPKFDIDLFLELVNTHYPRCTLSLGFTTNCCMLPYTRAMLKEMYDVTQRAAAVNQPITFPVRAGLLYRSWADFRELLMKDPSRFTITVWTPAGQDDWEGATPWEMIIVRNDVPKSLIYYDLPGDKFQRFRRDSITAGSPLNHLDAELSGTFDALNVTWAHAVNSQQELTDAMESDVMMLEADVLLQGQGTDAQTDIPIMAHPPATESDITLEEWISRVAHTKKGIKLDFKSIDVLEPALLILKRQSFSQPVWINADIFAGPGASIGSVPVDSFRFKQLVQQHFPACTWSIGWTTGWKNLPGDTQPVYTDAHVDEMLQYVQSVEQPVTYPVRAAMVARSLPQLGRLLTASRQVSLTVWSGSSDDVDVDGLVSLRDQTQPHRVFYDLPDDLMQEFLAGVETLSRRSIIT